MQIVLFLFAQKNDQTNQVIHAHALTYLGDNIDDISLFDRQLILILCFIWKEDFTLLTP